jgi:hypothetical protein
MTAETVGKQMPATWEVVGDSWGKAIGLTQTRNTGDTCNLLLAMNAVWVSCGCRLRSWRSRTSSRAASLSGVP